MTSKVRYRTNNAGFGSKNFVFVICACKCFDFEPCTCKLKNSVTLAVRDFLSDLRWERCIVSTGLDKAVDKHKQKITK